MSVQVTHEPRTEQVGKIDSTVFNAVARHFVRISDTVTAQFTENGLELWASRLQDGDEVDEGEEPGETMFVEATIPQSEWDVYPDLTDPVGIDSWDGLYKSLTGSLPETISVALTNDNVTIHETTTNAREPTEKIELSYLRLPTEVTVTDVSPIREWLRESASAEYLRVSLSEQFDYNTYNLSLRNAGEIEDPDRVVIETGDSWRVRRDSPLTNVTFDRDDAEKSYEDADSGSTRSVISFMKKNHVVDLFGKTLKPHMSDATYTLELKPVFPLRVSREFTDMDSNASLTAHIAPFKRENIPGEELDWKL